MFKSNILIGLKSLVNHFTPTGPTYFVEGSWTVAVSAHRPARAHDVGYALADLACARVRLLRDYPNHDVDEFLLQLSLAAEPVECVEE